MSETKLDLSERLDPRDEVTKKVLDYAKANHYTVIVNSYGVLKGFTPRQPGMPLVKALNRQQLRKMDRKRKKRLKNLTDEEAVKRDREAYAEFQRKQAELQAQKLLEKESSK